MKKIFTFSLIINTLFIIAQTGFVSGVPYFYQYNNTINPGGSCQNTSIAMVIKYYGGIAVTPDDISSYYGTSQAQTPSGLKQVFDSEAAYFGLSVRDVPHTNGTFSEIHALLAAGKPVIVHGYFTSYGHVLVITGYNGSVYTCNDPAGKWSQIYQYGGYSQTNSTEGHGVTYSKSAFEDAIGPDGTIWYHEIINTSTVTPPPSTVDIVPPTSIANISNPTNYKTSNFNVNFSDVDNSGGSGLDKSFYSVLDWNGTEWRGNNNNGFMCDNFDSNIHSDWTTGSGTWSISSNILNQTDEINTNTAFSANVNQTLSNRYIYHWLGNIDGTGTDRNAGIHIMSDNIGSVNRGNNYLVWFKADLDEVHIYEVVNDVISSPLKVFSGVTINTNTWYDYKVMYDRTTGKFTIWMNDDLIGTYTDTSPLATGNGFSFRTRECKYKINNFKIYRSRLSTSATVTVGNANADVRYQSPSPSNVSYSCKIKTLCVDNASNVSAVGNVDVLIDWTPPNSTPSVNDGLGSDISVTTSLNTLDANFSISTDANSGIKNYYYFIGTLPNDSSIVGSTNNGLNTSISKNGLTLTNGTTYYISVYSVNNAGLKSGVASSNGQTVNVSVPTAPTASVNSVNTICVGQPVALLDASTGVPTSWTWNMQGGTPTAASSQNISVTYTAAGVYTISLLASNATGSNTAVSTITVLANPILSVSATQSSLCAGNSTTLSANGASLITWSPSEELSNSSGATVISTPSASVVYTVTGSSGNCSSISMVSVVVNSNPVINASASNYTVCSGQTSALSVSGASSYSWSPSTALSSTTGSLIATNPTSNITYTVTGISGGCEGLATISLSVNPNPIINVVSTKTQICVGETTTLTANGANSYTWTSSSSLSSVNGNEVIANPTVTTLYNISGDNGICIGNGMFTLVVNTCTGIKQLNNEMDFSIYPNPFFGEINLKYYLPKDSEVEITLIDMLGKVITNQIFNDLSGNHSKFLNIDDAISQGIYSLKIKVGKDEIYRKLIKQ